MAHFSSKSQDEMIDLANALADNNIAVAPCYPQFNQKSETWFIKVHPRDSQKAKNTYSKLNGSEYGLGYMQNLGAA